MVTMGIATSVWALARSNDERNPMHRRLWLSVAAIATGLSLLTVAGFAGAATSASGVVGKTGAAGKTGGTLRINLSETDFDFLDPALSYSNWTWQFTYLTDLKLLNYPDKPRPEGSQLVAEAADLPVVSADGKTYTFTVKPGFKFNTGEVVTAQSFADAIDRTLNPKMQSPGAGDIFAGAILGYADMVAGKTKHTAGVTVKGNKLTIKLSKVDPAFLSKISLPFFTAIPKGMPINDKGEHTPPMAGPYYIKSYDVGRQAIFERNPNYKGPRPHNPDRIVVTINTDLNQSLLQVRAGQADFDAGGLPPEQVASLAPVLGKQFLVDTQLEVDYLALNTSAGHFFSDLNARKAANYAIDRPAMLRARGAFAGKRTDQLLPPGIAGFRDEKIYPFKGADPAKAKTFYNKGGKITVYTANAGAALIQGQVLQYNFKQIGIDTNIQQFTSAVLYSKSGTQGEPFDAAVVGWGSDYPDPSDFLDVLLNGKNIQATNNNNKSYLNAPEVNEALDKAAVLSGAARDKAYGDADIMITTKYAPVAAFLNRNERTFISSRLDPKCYVFQPIYTRMDLATSCLK
jgi:peptide/nickel transport system substrate-binding protein